ncbi:MAG: 6,7-dimethyl-8-ribityllumazine synthase [Nitrospinota bacterium]
MPRVIEGRLKGEGLKIGVVASRFNEFITRRLIEGALDALTRHGVAEGDIDVVRVPGSFELPFVAKRMAESGSYAAIVCLGAIIRGDTPHYEYIAAEVTKGIAQTALESGVPLTLGVITTDSIEQAIERAGAKAGNKGFDAAMSALEMANLIPQLGKRRRRGS